MNIKTFNNFKEVFEDIENKFNNEAHGIKTEKWQGIKLNFKMKEIFNFSFSVPLINFNFDNFKEEIKPNLPWAENHFLERVRGEPLNPGLEWKNWPYASSANNFRTEKEKFTHTYMERYWPKYANNQGNIPNGGIRYDYGDLNDVIQLLKKEPLTRQAFLPVWFPEDTGVSHGGRVPCSIGYQFIRRFNYLHVVYWLRSCDYIRHFRDDIYLTTRLTMFILQNLKKQKEWEEVEMGYYTQHTTSLHIFNSDFELLKKGKNL